MTQPKDESCKCYVVTGHEASLKQLVGLRRQLPENEQPPIATRERLVEVVLYDHGDCARAKNLLDLLESLGCDFSLHIENGD